ncbi:MAG: YegS/Rv2252/BmrU family lipid kinase [Candidatus Aminicenantes bacterium]|nr:YegS/Rv2252/BmrU family lipid kinase [Candidatus Aminicenantes bacterium]
MTFPKSQKRLKTQIIINPESNKGQTGKKWGRIQEALKSFFKEFKYEFTEMPTHATEISRAAIKEGSELIVGVGGDGTMNEIANGFFENKKIINPDTSLGIVPSGTGSDFSKSLNIPPQLNQSIKVITQNNRSDIIDIGRVQYQSLKGESKERFFLNIGDFGFGAEVVKQVEKKRLKRKASSYLRSVIFTFISYKNKRLNIKVDGKEYPTDDYLIGAISNGSIFGKGMKVAPLARLDDGFFDVILVKGMEKTEFFLNVWRLYQGTHLTHSKIAFLRGKKIEVSSANHEDVLIEVDGELIGKAPAVFEIIPGSFPVRSNLTHTASPA